VGAHAVPPTRSAASPLPEHYPYSSQNPRHRSLPTPLAAPPSALLQEQCAPAAHTQHAKAAHTQHAKAEKLRMLQRMSQDALPSARAPSAAAGDPQLVVAASTNAAAVSTPPVLSVAEAAAEQERLRMYALAQCKQTNTLFVDDIGFEDHEESEVEHMPDEKLLALLKLPVRAQRFCKKGKPRAVTVTVSGDGRELVCTPLEGDRKSAIRVLLRDVEELRKGQKTMIFEKQRQPELNGRSFSLVYGFKRTLNLVLSREREFEVLTVGLVRLISILKDEDSATALVAKEWNRFELDVLSRHKIETLLRRLNFKIGSRELKRRVKEVDSSGRLVFDQFLHLLSLLCERPTVVELFERYSSNKSYLTDGEFLHFLHAEQHDSHLHVELARELMARFQAPGELGMTREAFSSFLSSNANSPMDPCRAVVSHDMHQPLSHYYVNTSHNTYLEGHQLRGRSSTDMYIRAMRNGCRCVELDCHDGDDGEAVIYHGHTLTSRIRFRDVIEAVRDYGFETTQFPLVLSLEIHNGKRQQRAMAAALRELLEPMLPARALHLEQPDARQLPSPHQLRGLVLLKGSGKLVPELDELIYLKGGSFTAAPDLLQSRPAFSMCSLDESKLAALRQADVARYTATHLARIYPKGTRFDSSNYDPFTAWNSGCQLVALNLQTSDAPVWFNEGRFRENGNCGYLLKPPPLLHANVTPFDHSLCSAADPPPADCAMRVLRVRVISGRQFPKPSNDSKEIVDPFVRLEVRGVAADDQRAKTKKVSQNGFSPRWDDTFTFELVMADAAQLLFLICDKDLTKSTKLGYASFPVSALRPGYRMITFSAVDGSGQIPFCDLLCHFAFG
jgi:Ca2+-binding EF-hand superfamily protein